MTSIRLPEGTPVTDADVTAIAALLGVDKDRVSIADDASPRGSWIYDRADEPAGPAPALTAGVTGFPLGSRWKDARG